MAKLTNYTKAHLCNIESGRRKVTPEVVDRYDTALGKGGLLVDLLMANNDEDSVKRRAILAALGRAASLGVSGSGVINESLRASLMAAMGGDDWEEIAHEYGSRFMTDHPLRFRTQLTGDLLILRQSLLESQSTAASLAAPKLMTLQAMALANAGETGTATRWYRAARIAADRSGDDNIRQWVRGREAFRRGYEGATPDEVIQLANGVHDVEAYLAMAAALARVGQPTQSIKALQSARRVHETTDQSESTIYAMPPWRMALSTSYIYALLGDVARCDHELRMVAPPDSVKRWESQAVLQSAVAHAKSGDRKYGQELSRQVLADTKEPKSVVLAEMAKEANSAI